MNPHRYSTTTNKLYLQYLHATKQMYHRKIAAGGSENGRQHASRIGCTKRLSLVPNEEALNDQQQACNNNAFFSATSPDLVAVISDVVVQGLSESIKFQYLFHPRTITLSYNRHKYHNCKYQHESTSIFKPSSRT
jgi:hypothetical protein